MVIVLASITIVIKFGYLPHERSICVIIEMLVTYTKFGLTTCFSKAYNMVKM